MFSPGHSGPGWTRGIHGCYEWEFVKNSQENEICSSSKLHFGAHFSCLRVTREVRCCPTRPSADAVQSLCETFDTLGTKMILYAMRASEEDA